LFNVEYFVTIIINEGGINLFSTRLKELRKKKGLTQKEAAKQLAIPRTTYSGYERGTSEPDFNTLNKLSKFYDVDSNWLLEDKKESEHAPPEEIMVKIIKEAEAEYKVSLRDDPVVESALRDLIHNLAKMKKSAKTND
jgi:transcriptional regulator with XRE-family HTH domain